MNRGVKVLTKSQKALIAASLGDLDKSPADESFKNSFEDLEDEEIMSNNIKNKHMQSQAYVEDKTSINLIPIEAERYVQSLVELKDEKHSKSTTQTKYTLQDRIAQVQNGSYIHKCIHSSAQDLTKGNCLLQTKEGRFYHNINHNYKRLDDGSLEMINKELLKKQKQVLGFLMKQFGSLILSGKSITSISLPVGVFEPRSLLERLAESFVFAPHFLEKGGMSSNTLEQFKQAFAFYLTTLAADLNPEKPFNPILGETFQGIIGGCPVYLEQISHHPPIAAFQMIGKSFQIEGTFEFHAAISANSVKCRKIGDFKVIFPNTGAVIQAQFPIGLMSGTAFGKRTFQNSKKLQVYDFNNHLYCEVDFDKSESAKKRKEIPGYFSSNIFKTTEKFSTKTKQELFKTKDAEIKFKEKDHAQIKLDIVEGSWLESLTFNNEIYWSHNNPSPFVLQYFDNPLPSDSNFRLDVLYLKAGDEMKAQDKKVLLEELQRKDRKLKENAKQKNYK